MSKKNHEFFRHFFEGLPQGCHGYELREATKLGLGLEESLVTMGFNPTSHP